MAQQRKAGPVSTLGVLSQTMAISKQEIKEKCMKALLEVGSSDEFCNFFGDVLQCEHDMNSTLWRLQQSMKQKNGEEALESGVLLRLLQELTKGFNIWSSTIDILSERGREIAPLTIDPIKARQSKVLTALCSLETREVHLREGEPITITDTTQPNRLTVRTGNGEEGVVPTLCCILPTPDRTALTATERLRIQLLASWTECMKTIRVLLMESLQATTKRLTNEWKYRSQNGSTGAGDRVARRFRRIQEAACKSQNCDFNKLHNSLFSLEKELGSLNINGTDIIKMVETVANLDKSVLCYQMFSKQWYLFRKSMERDPHRPVRIVDHILNLRPPGNGRNYKYYEYKTTVENVETVEEIVYMSTDESEMAVGGGGQRTQTVEADQITSTEQEERKRFIIRSVVDPRNKRFLSIQEAVQLGVVDQDNGLYVNPDTGEGMPIPEAMNNGFIKVDFVTSTKSREQTKAVGLITIKTKVDSRAYEIVGAIDAVTGEKLELDEARKRGLINEAEGYYFMAETGEKVPLNDAVLDGWILAEYDTEDGEPEYKCVTYAIHAVVDQRNKTKVQFYEAVKRGLIDKDTGNYVNNKTGERMYVAEAIKRGFLKAKIVDDPSSLDIDTENKMVVERMDMIRKNVLKTMGVISAFKGAARKTTNSHSKD